MTLVDELKDWTDLDAAALALGRALGVFSATTTLADARAVLWTNGRAGNTLDGILQRLVWLGVLEQDDNGQRIRAARATLHPLTPVGDVPSLEAAAPAEAELDVQVDGASAPVLTANRAGFRYLGRVLEEIADSGLDGASGWEGDVGALRLRLVEAPDEPV